MAYIIKGRPQEEKYNALEQMASLVEILSLNKAQVLAAIAQPVPDFEDIPHCSSISFVERMDTILDD